MKSMPVLGANACRAKVEVSIVLRHVAKRAASLGGS